MLITKDMKLAAVIHANYMLIPIITRFEIRFGFGDDDIETVCKKNKINSAFFLEILNTFNNREYKSKKKLENISMKTIIDFLLKSHSYYNNEKIPYIKSLIHELKWTDNNGEENKRLIESFFERYCNEVLEHTKQEEKVIYPYALEIEDAYINGMNNGQIDSSKIKNIQEYIEEHEGLDEALLDLKNIIIKYLPPADNHQLVNRILEELFKLETDLINHTGIENKLMIPELLHMEKELKLIN